MHQLLKSLGLVLSLLFLPAHAHAALPADLNENPAPTVLVFSRIGVATTSHSLTGRVR